MLITQKIPFKNIHLTGAFWQNRQNIVANTTLQCLYDRFKETGRFDAVKCDWKEGMKNQPHIYWDSDVAKWIEGASYVLVHHPDKQLEQQIDGVVDAIAGNQEEYGYFNSYFQTVEKNQKFTRRIDHELYCAGHLIEAAVAYYNATKKDRLLKVMCKYVDYIDTRFRVVQDTPYVTPGHQEIELALVKLYDATGERRYLELSKFFIDMRGNNDKDTNYDFGQSSYLQDHLPVREQTTAEGHAVRVTYMLCAMADLAANYNDKALLDASEAIFNNIVQKRMYLTGGVGSTHVGEAFTMDYDLPNASAYAETCAAIGMILFCSRMSAITQKSDYADTAELALYNGFLSALSLDGTSFFYDNPLEMDPKMHERYHCTNYGGKFPFYFPPAQRQALFDVSCCPTNIVRLIAAVGDILYSEREETIFVHHYMASESENITVETDYPADGRITVTAGDGYKTVALRIPGWCTAFKLSHQYTIKDGYAYVAANGEKIILLLSMEPVILEASPHLQENAGRVAVKRGPVVYCLEEAENGNNLRDIVIDLNTEFTVSDGEFLLPTLKATGYRRKQFDTLYRPVKADYTRIPLQFIPYFSYANRGSGEMIVWILFKL